MKTISLSLRPEEWRQLRLWAAQEGASVAAIVERVVRGELERRPRSGP